MPLVRKLYPKKCPAADSCRSCFSFVRRYREGERRTHKDHMDIQALVTVVVSLNDFGVDYKGGLYGRAGGSSARHFIPLRAGDGAVHSSNLLHGVDVFEGERWSYINWISDSVSCDPADSREWHREDAENGEPIAQFLHAMRMPLFRSFALDRQAYWFERSANAGYGRAMNELGSLYRDKGTSQDLEIAEKWFRRAADLGEENAMFNLGQIRLGQGRVQEAVDLFHFAAKQRSSDAATNMGVAFMKGAGGRDRNVRKAAFWFSRAQSAESMFHTHTILSDLGFEDDAACWLLKSATLGHDQAMSLMARRHAQFGDVKESTRWLQKLAIGGDRNALDALGAMEVPTGSYADLLRDFYTREETKREL
eukprot:g3061.t1